MAVQTAFFFLFDVYTVLLSLTRFPSSFCTLSQKLLSQRASDPRKLFNTVPIVGTQTRDMGTLPGSVLERALCEQKAGTCRKAVVFTVFFMRTKMMVQSQ